MVSLHTHIVARHSMRNDYKIVHTISYLYIQLISTIVNNYICGKYLFHNLCIPASNAAGFYLMDNIKTVFG
jgi:hypothetical protein